MQKLMGNIEESNDSLAVVHLADENHDGHVGSHKLQVHFCQIKVQTLHKATHSYHRTHKF